MSMPGPLEDPQATSDNDGIYEVDRIIAERRNQYKIRWLGYDAAEDSWVLKSELQKTAPDVVAAWQKAQN